ncbi:Uncharacterized protein HZ326_25765 [Fusarium oxysporum f. sp. albedinis]|nr:Uncharacterized protein HZ326_25765 [Fusarium oxysporum f. sp. albedinis]
MYIFFPFVSGRRHPLSSRWPKCRCRFQSKPPKASQRQTRPDLASLIRSPRNSSPQLGLRRAQSLLRHYASTMFGLPFIVHIHTHSTNTSSTRLRCIPFSTPQTSSWLPFFHRTATVISPRPACDAHFLIPTSSLRLHHIPPLLT